MLDWVRKGKTYYIKRSGEAYQLLIPEENPMDVGHWKPILCEESFANFYSILVEQDFPKIIEGDRIFFDPTITQREKDHIEQAFILYKARNIGGSILYTAIEKSEFVRGKAPAPIEGLQQRVLSALEEFFG